MSSKDERRIIPVPAASNNKDSQSNIYDVGEDSISQLLKRYSTATFVCNLQTKVGVEYGHNDHLPCNIVQHT